MQLGAKAAVLTIALSVWPLALAAQVISTQGGVPTRGYSGGAITFAAPAASYLAPAVPSASPTTGALPSGDDTLIITSRGSYRYGTQSTDFVARPSVQRLAPAPVPPLPPAPPPADLGAIGAAPAPSPAPRPAAATIPAAGTPRTTSGGYGQGIVSEARLGLSLHDLGAFSDSDESGVDVDLELLFGSPAFLSVIGEPRPHIGGKINTAGDTSYGYFGLTWDWLVHEWFIVEAALGSAIHDGDLDDDAEKDLGCRAVLRGAVATGVQFAERHKLLVVFDHATNASLCGDYQSLDGLGIRYGILF